MLSMNNGGKTELSGSARQMQHEIAFCSIK